MTLGHILTGIILVSAGIVLYYYLLPKRKDETQEEKLNTNSALNIISFIFIFLGLSCILTFCLGIDGGNYTPQKEDDMNVLNGVIISICALSLERNIIYFLRKFKNYRQCKKLPEI